jgi:membrane-associated phospholipid phosphatase
LAYAYAFPERFSEMVYRGALLGENRIVAGMHSPVDVIGGKTMALALACAALNQDSVMKNAEKAVETMYQFVSAQSRQPEHERIRLCTSERGKPQRIFERRMGERARFRQQSFTTTKHR